MSMGSDLKIIIVDDNETFRNSLNIYLTKRLNHKVIAQSESGIKALQLPKISEADIIDIVNTVSVFFLSLVFASCWSNVLKFSAFFTLSSE